LEVRKATLASVLAKAGPGLRFNEHIEADGPTVFAHACRMGLEGIVSKRRDLPYRSGKVFVVPFGPRPNAAELPTLA
jgi:bifunctional non-homologous end joining protein LigD